MRAVQRVALESADEKVTVIDERILDARFRQIRGQLRLPDALREPQSGRRDAEAPLEVLAHARDLLEAIEAGERRENRLVESGEQQFQAAVGREPANHVEPRGGLLAPPLAQR